uniref:Uncharacterized protein AlNc14C967G12673 n=1 Tax=Albugo laibachii Nc14 TaxID=890382 RepID=F0X2C3_9STRA|nr:conserved hypothetical protein [Albugo laibachii Nc14]|eukprot:CCA28008.1 conserved hypothetical protein [Albugo laibachii Nc14]
MQAMISLRLGMSANSVFDYQLDGKTTYCYWLKQGLQVENPDASYIYDSGADNACPATLQIDREESESIFVDTPELFHFKVTENLENAFKVKKLYTSPDPFTARPAQIAHANIHICMANTKCDILRAGMGTKISTQETSNFTKGSADFWQSMTFDEPGKHIVFAHVILPPKDITRERYDMLIFTTATVEMKKTNKSFSIGAIMGIVMGCLAFVVLLCTAYMYWRRARIAQKNSASFFLQPLSASPSRKVAKSPNTASKLGWSLGNDGGATYQTPAFCGIQQLSGPIKLSNTSDSSTHATIKNLSFHMSHTVSNLHKGKDNYLVGDSVHLAEFDSIENDQTLELIQDDIPVFDAPTHTEDLFPSYPGIYGSKNRQDT